MQTMWKTSVVDVVVGLLKNMTTELQRYQGALLGLAVGDALGVPAEFQTRGTFPKVTEMVGGGVFMLDPGEWTDDTSMALCLGQSLLDKNGFDAVDQMTKYWAWIESGYMASNGRMFDIGDTTSDALCRFRKDGNPMAGNEDPKCSGNGSLMRLAPIPMFFSRIDAGIPMYVHNAQLMSATTHASPDCMLACGFMSGLILGALRGESKDMILSQGYCPQQGYWKTGKLSPILVDSIMGTYKSKTKDHINSSGWVLHTLEAALWCFHNSTTFEDGLIEAVNLGEDADTTGAVYGQLAGAYYGVDSIPKRWVDKTVKVDLIIDMANKIYNKRTV